MPLIPFDYDARTVRAFKALTAHFQQLKRDEREVPPHALLGEFEIEDRMFFADLIGA